MPVTSFHEYARDISERLNEILNSGQARALIFRYDNAAHRPSPLSRPHKHFQVDVIDCPIPTLAAVIDEILKRIGP